MSEAIETAGTTKAGKPDRPLLGAIRAATLTASDLAAAETAWTKWMGYEVAHRGPISETVARAWGAPALAGRRVVVLGPTSGAPTYLRFVEQDTPDDGRPKHAQGWTTVELTVRNSDELYERLKDSPFRVAGPPR